MPYSPAHKAETRARIVECARRMFNRHGFDAVSIDDIMGFAGLTRGGFYNHFRSKDELYREAITSFRERADSKCSEKRSAAGDQARLAAEFLVRSYLGPERLEDIDSQCPLVALPSDVARAGPAVREAYCELLDVMIGVFEAALEGDDDKRRKALGAAILCVGGMVLARTAGDKSFSEEVCAAAEHFALAVCAPAAEAVGTGTRAGALSRS